MSIKFSWRFLCQFRSYSFFCKDGFLPFLHTFLRITPKPLNTFKIWLSHMNERLNTNLNHYRFHFKNKFYKVKSDFLGSILPIFTLLFRKIGPSQAYYRWFTQYKLVYNFFSKKLRLFVPWFRSHKLILNEILWFERGTCSTVAQAWLACRNSIANAEQSKLFALFFLLLI